MKLVADRTHYIQFKAPVEIGQVIMSNVIGQETNLIATRKVKIKV